jgi:transposase InsO family protein
MRTRYTKGETVVIGVLDDHTRLAYCELHGAENAVNAAATLRRAVVWFAEQGCSSVQAVMSDNAKCYAQSHTFRQALTDLGARHILIPPFTPRWNGKIERFFRTANANGATAASGRTPASATALCHRSFASITASALTAPPAAGHPSPASSKSASRTPSAEARRLPTNPVAPVTSARPGIKSRRM